VKFQRPILSATLILIISVVLLSCSQTEQKVTEPILSKKANPTVKGGEFRIDDWTDIGIVHNSCMRMLDDSLAVRSHTDFSNSKALTDWAVNMLSDHLINDLGYDSAHVNPERRYYLQTGWFQATRSQFQEITADLLADVKISSREYDYLMRLSNILYNYSWSYARITDSLTSFKNDVNLVSWTSQENAIIPIMSIAYYSWDFRNEGLDDSDPNNEIEINWPGVGASDVQGGLWGWDSTWNGYDVAAGAIGISAATLAIEWWND
jgi:hypothetical protein